MEFRKAYEPFEREYQPSGEKIVKIRKQIVNEKGEYDVIEVEENIYEKIQESAESVDIHNILERALRGDTTALDKVEGHYIDCSDMPTSLAQAQSLIMRVKDEFDALPIDVKAKFNHSPEQYVAEMGSDKWAEKTGLKKRWEDQKRMEEATRKREEDILNNLANLGKGGVQ